MPRPWLTSHRWDVGGEPDLPALARRGQHCLRTQGPGLLPAGCGLLCPGAWRGTALLVRGRDLSQPYAQQPASYHLPLSIPVMGLAPHLSPHPGNHQPEAPAPVCLVWLTSEGGDTAPIHQSPRQIQASSFLPGKPLKTPELLLACKWCVLLLPLPMPHPLAEVASETLHSCP